MSEMFKMHGVWAVHISDNFLSQPVIWSGFAIAILFAYLGSRRLQEEEIPRVALLTAAFFVGSLLHVRIPPTTVHLLLNGLVGVVLGRRAAVALPLGLLLQYFLLQHGGLLSLGANTVVLLLPALCAHALFHKLMRMQLLKRTSVRSGLIFFATFFWSWSLVFSLFLLLRPNITDIALDTLQAALRVTYQPVTLALLVGVSALACWWEAKHQHAWEFPVGLLVGEFAVLFTVFLHALVLGFGAEQQEGWHFLVLLSCVLHLPIAAVEGVILGYTVTFILRVRPEMIQISPQPASREFPGPSALKPEEKRSEQTPPC